MLFLIHRMSTRVLLATLSIPITPERTDIARLLDMDGIIVEKHRRLATLLGLQSPPTRQSLINDMVRHVHETQRKLPVSVLSVNVTECFHVCAAGEIQPAAVCRA